MIQIQSSDQTSDVQLLSDDWLVATSENISRLWDKLMQNTEKIAVYINLPTLLNKGVTYLLSNDTTATIFYFLTLMNWETPKLQIRLLITCLQEPKARYQSSY